jgi:Fe-S-cluster-containing dehydrogenase component
MCSGCGYVMDACTNFTADVVPREGDMSLCMNCATVYFRRGGAWAPATVFELAVLSPEEARDLALHIRAQRRVIGRDLMAGKRSGRA